MKLLFFFLQLVAGSFSLTQYSDSRGYDELSDNEIIAACRDSLGFIWAETESSLLRFDGNSFVQMGEEVNSILPDGKSVHGMKLINSHTLLFYTKKGLFLFDTKTRSVKILESLKGVNVHTVFDHISVPEGNVFVSTRSGLFLVDYVSDFCRCIYSAKSIYRGGVCDSSGRLVLNIGHEIKLLSFDDSFNLTAEEHLADGFVDVRLFIDSFNNIYAFNKTMLYNASLEGLLKGTSSFKAEGIEVTSMGEFENALLVCLRGNGCRLSYRDSSGNCVAEDFISLSHDVNYLSNNVNKIYCDDADRCAWLCTSNGLYALKAGTDGVFLSHLRNNLNNPSSLSHNTINDILILDDGNIWVATANGLDKVRRVAGGNHIVDRFFVHGNEDNILDNKLEQLEIGPDGLLWIGTKGGVLFADTKDGRMFHKPEIDKSFDGCEFVRSLCAENNNMWVGFSIGGVFRYEYPEGRLTKVDIPEGTCMDIVTDLLGNIWVSQQEGRVFFFPHGEVECAASYNLPSAGPLFVDTYNNVWCGTSSGLFRLNYKDGLFEKVEIALPSNDHIVKGIISDNLGNLWTAGLHGLCVYNLSEQKSSYIVPEHTRITRQDYVFEFAKDKEGVIYMSGINGLTWFDPAVRMASTDPVECHFSQFKVSGRDPKIGSGEIDSDINYADRITLQHTDNQISFLPSVFSYFGKHTIQYACRLDDVDPDWVYLGTRPGLVSYSNIPTGRHMLSVRCTNALGEWQDPRVIEIVVVPHMLLRWYFIVAYLFAIVLACVLAYHSIRMRRRLSTQKAINETSLKFYSEMVENMKNPYTLLKAPLQRLADEKESLSMREMKYLLDTARRGSDSMGLIIEQLSERCELDSGVHSLNMSFVDMSQFVSGICLSFKAPFMSKGVLVNDECGQSPSLMVPFDKAKMENVSFEILSFLFRNAVSGSHVSVSCRSENPDTAIVDFKSNGVHLSQRALDSFFDIGLGLPLARDIVRLHKGSINVTSDESEGICVSVCLPAPSRNELLYRDLMVSKPDHSHTLDSHIANISAVRSDTVESPEGAPKVFLVMKEEQIRDFLANTLAPHMRVNQFDSPESALEAAGKEHPDLIVSGLLFSREKRGLEFCRKVKNSATLGYIPFMILTSISDEASQNAAYAAGADAFVTKPYTTSSLIARIANLINSKADIISKAKKEIISTPINLEIMSADEKFLAGAMKIIEKNIGSESFSVSDFSSGMCLSSSMLYRKIKALTGMSPNEFIKDVRMKRAAQLLETNAFTISGVAYEVGFSDVHYFSTCFRKAFGLTPSEYKQKNGR